MIYTPHLIVFEMFLGVNGTPVFRFKTEDVGNR